MNITLRYCGLNARTTWLTLIEAHLGKLQALAAIASARVTLEWQSGGKPAFRVLALLEVPGPDFHAEASDYTLPAALLKVVKSLERQIRCRESRRVERRKRNVHPRLVRECASSCAVGASA